MKTKVQGKLCWVLSLDLNRHRNSVCFTENTRRLISKEGDSAAEDSHSVRQQIPCLHEFYEVKNVKKLTGGIWIVVKYDTATVKWAAGLMLDLFVVVYAVYVKVKLIIFQLDFLLS